jgi:hypothetical protein
MKSKANPIYREYPGGTKEWTLDGLLHREDGPAYEGFRSHKEWWYMGKRHRIGGPAVEWADGSKSWWLNNNLHREDGPAIEEANGYKCWYLDGIAYTEQKYWKLLFKYGKITEKELFLRLL